MALKQKQKSKKYIKKVKSFAFCQNCGIDDDICLEFHHLNDKKFTIANAIRLGMCISSIKQEMRKCIVLCSNCHRELHFLEKYKNLSLQDIFKLEIQKTNKINNLKNCKHCNKEFKGTKKNRLYCSDICQSKNTKIRKKKEYLENYKNNPPEIKTKKHLLKEKGIRRKDLKNKIKEYILTLKFNSGCQNCGDKRWFCLDFHHKEDKKKNVSSMLSQAYGVSTIKKEISKCELLCANCHKKEHENKGNCI